MTSMGKQTYASVTDVVCQCGHMETLARDPAMPIRFDADLNEYRIEYVTPKGDIAAIFVYHCIFCGGAMPPSKRDKLFESIPAEEKARLQQLVAQLKTAEDVLRVMGTPDFDDPIPPEWQSTAQPNAARPTKTLTYAGKSNVANIHINVAPDGSVQALVTPKRKAG